MRKKQDYFGKFNELFESENWKNDTSGWTGVINNLTTELRNLDPYLLGKEKLEAQANLRYSELNNENVILKHGLPIVSLFSSAVALLISLFGDNAIPNAESISVMLFVFFGSVFIGYIFGEFCRNNRQKEIVYYQTKLKIIESIEKERKTFSNSEVNISHNKTKYYTVEAKRL